MINIQVKTITVKTYRIICIVKLSGSLYSNENIKRELLKNFPSLAQHKCKNLQGKNFESIMNSTSIAHILEHLIIDFQIKSLNANLNFSNPLYGTTQWINKPEGIAKIEFSFYDDLIALSSLNKATDFLTSIQD